MIDRKTIRVELKPRPDQMSDMLGFLENGQHRFFESEIRVVPNGKMVPEGFGTIYFADLGWVKFVKDGQKFTSDMTFRGIELVPEGEKIFAEILIY